MNPVKCVLRNLSSPFLKLSARQWVIQKDPSTIKVIIEMPYVKTQAIKVSSKVISIDLTICFQPLWQMQYIIHLGWKIPKTHLRRWNYTYWTLQFWFVVWKPLILYTIALDRSLGALFVDETNEHEENTL